MARKQSVSGQSAQQQLLRVAQNWAALHGFDADQARELRRQAILSNHEHYLETIPAYKRLAYQEGIGFLDEIEPIKQHLMFPDDLFKSYNQEWLDENNYARMNEWLSEIHHQPVSCNVAGLSTIDAWIDRLAHSGIRLVYSSGTSGNFSFVPRDAAAWELFRTASMSYLLPTLMRRKVGTGMQRLLVGLASRFLPPDLLIRSGRNMRLPGYDAFFLDFKHGRTGNQTLEQELGPLFRRCSFLYETDLSPSVLRLMSRGTKTHSDRDQLLALQEVVIKRKEENYDRLISQIKQATLDGQKVFIFGTPHLFKELCEILSSRADGVNLRDGSLILFGGGWKSFSGEQISRQRLVELMTGTLGLPLERILEGYSMTEINAFMLRCEHDRFHIPPFIEPVIFNEKLEVMEGDNIHGIFGFLDPMATACPGFLISGDEVHLVTGECECGLVGPAVTEIGRAGNREVKGCGGIMASLAV